MDTGSHKKLSCPIIVWWSDPAKLVVRLNGGEMMRQVVLSLGEDGYWVAECPSLPGCIAQGKTMQEAIANIKEAIEGYIVSLEEDGFAVAD